MMRVTETVNCNTTITCLGIDANRPARKVPFNTFTGWNEVEKLSRAVGRDEIAKNDFNISPSRYINTSEDEGYRPLAEIIEELRDLDDEAALTSAQLNQTLLALGG